MPLGVRLIAGGAACLGGGLLAANFIAGLGCDLENSGCALAGPPHLWQGRLFTTDGRPADAATVQYVFASHQPAGRPLGRLVSLSTDEHGRYCLRWPRESARAYVWAAAVRSSHPADGRLASMTPASGPIILTPDASGAVAQDPSHPGVTVGHPWEPALDQAPSCITRSPAWYRIEGLRGNWRFRLLMWLSVATLLSGAAGVAAGRRPVAHLAAGLAGADAVLFILIWATHTL